MGPEVKSELLRILKLGVPMHHACVAVGLNPNTAADWLHKAKHNPRCAQSFRDFAKEVSEAISGSVVERVEDLVEMESEKVRAASIRWLLSRRHPNEFGDPGKRLSPEQEEQQRQAQAELHAIAMRKATAEAAIAEAKARIAEAASKGEARGVVLSPVDLLALLEGEVRAQVAAVLEQHGLVLRVLQHLLADVDEAEMMEATGLSHGGALPLME